MPYDADVVVNLFFSVLNDQTTKPPREVRRMHYFDGDVSMLESAEKRREAGIDEIHWPKIVRMRSTDPQFAVYYRNRSEERPKQLRAAPGENNTIDTILLFLHVASGKHDAYPLTTEIGGKHLRDFKCNIESVDAQLALEVISLSKVLQEPRFLQRAEEYF